MAEKSKEQMLMDEITTLTAATRRANQRAQSIKGAVYRFINAQFPEVDEEDLPESVKALMNALDSNGEEFAGKEMENPLSEKQMESAGIIREEDVQ